MIEGLYLHIPFCARRCHYCDFNTYEGMEGLAPDYVAALARDMELSGEILAARSAPLQSIFFGGGTPSLLAAPQIENLIASAKRVFGLRDGAEITLEANPGTADLEKFRGFRAAGVNRISFGFQAKQERHLQALGRIHDSAQSAEAWRLARLAGFENMSLDLMFGLSGQTMQEWEESLDWALAFEPEHLSFYGLTIEAGTRYHHLSGQGKLPLPDEDLQADMYALGISRLAGAGLEQYEISNFSKKGRASVHNRLYWRNRETLGLGAGAWSFVSGERFSREKNPPIYIEEIKKGRIPLAEKERLQGQKARGEAAYLGLRMLEGIDLNAWRAENDIDLLEEFAEPAQDFLKSGHLEIKGQRLRLTPLGLPLANRVFSAFL